jgi:hypothetical protein
MASIDVKLDDGGITSVGAVERWDWPSAEEAEAARDEATRKTLTSELTDAILWAIAKPSRGGLRADKQSPNWAGYAVMPAVGLDVTRKQDKVQMDTWLKLLVKSEDLTEYQDSGPDRHPVMFLGISEKTRRRLDESGN